MVIWVIGLSGSGKTTFANEFCSILNNNNAKFVKIDGDVIRDIFQNDLGHNYKDRRKNANRIMRLCHFLDQNGINVICSILSVSEEDRVWNRENISNYFEIFIDVKNINISAKTSHESLSDVITISESNLIRYFNENNFQSYI